MEASWERVDGPSAGRSIEKNWLFELRAERFRSRRSGVEHEHFVVHLADAVSVVAITPEGEVVLVRQFRGGSRLDHLETPGGLLAEGEGPLDAGPRELREETGYAGDSPESIGSVYTNPALLTTQMEMVVVRNARKVGNLQLDHAEEVAVELVPLAEARRMLLDGRIDHALAAVTLLRFFADGLRGPAADQGAIDGSS